MARDPRVDDYIFKAAPFAQPILIHLRELIHMVCPEVVEKWKWSMPNFDYHGAPLAHMAAFKAHCTLGFWKASLMKNNQLLMMHAQGNSAMGHLGPIKSLKDLPADKILTGFIKQGMALNEAGIKVARTQVKKSIPETPEDLIKAFLKNKGTENNFQNMSPSKRREFIDWINSAKREETRFSRIQKAIDLIKNNKHLNSKYEK